MRCFLKHDKTGQHIHCPNQKTANKIRSEQEQPKDWSLLLTEQESQALLKRAKKQRLNFQERLDADRAIWKVLAKNHEEKTT